MLTIVLQQGINGILFGSLYVLVALGLTLIYGVLVQINFAHADIVTIGAFAAYFFTFLFGWIMVPPSLLAILLPVGRSGSIPAPQVGYAPGQPKRAICRPNAREPRNR